MKTVTKKEIVKVISEKTECSQQLAGEVFQCALEVMLDALTQHGRIELRNFGIFEVKERKPRQGVNPKTGKKFHVARHYALTFAPGKKLSEQIDEAFLARELH